MGHSLFLCRFLVAKLSTCNRYLNNINRQLIVRLSCLCYKSFITILPKKRGRKKPAKSRAVSVARGNERKVTQILPHPFTLFFSLSRNFCNHDIDCLQVKLRQTSPVGFQFEATRDLSSVPTVVILLLTIKLFLLIIPMLVTVSKQNKTDKKFIFNHTKSV